MVPPQRGPLGAACPADMSCPTLVVLGRACEQPLTVLASAERNRRAAPSKHLAMDMGLRAPGRKPRALMTHGEYGVAFHVAASWYFQQLASITACASILYIQ